MTTRKRETIKNKRKGFLKETEVEARKHGTDFPRMKTKIQDAKDDGKTLKRRKRNENANRSQVGDSTCLPLGL